MRTHAHLRAEPGATTSTGQGGRPRRRAVGGRPGGGGAGGGSVSADEGLRRRSPSGSTRPCWSRTARRDRQDPRPSWITWWRWSPPGRGSSGYGDHLHGAGGRGAARAGSAPGSTSGSPTRRPPPRCGTGPPASATTWSAPSCPRSTRSARRCCGPCAAEAGIDPGDHGAQPAHGGAAVRGALARRARAGGPGRRRRRRHRPRPRPRAADQGPAAPRRGADRARRHRRAHPGRAVPSPPPPSGTSSPTTTAG